MIKALKISRSIGVNLGALPHIEVSKFPGQKV